MLRVASVSVNSYFGTYFVVTISLLIPLLLIGGIAIIAAQVCEDFNIKMEMENSKSKHFIFIYQAMRCIWPRKL